MGIVVTLRGGSGDMSRHVYDPNLDGVIDVAETEADMTKAVFDPDGNNKIDAAQIEGSTTPGAITDYVDCTDKELDNVVAPDSCSGTVYENVGIPYTVTKADMDDKTGDIKVTLDCEIHSSHGSYACVAGYNIDGGGDVQIGSTNLIAYTPKSITLVEVAVGQILQFRLKEAGSCGHIQKMVITQTHAARKDNQILSYY